MFTCGQGKCKSGNMMDALEDTSITSSEKTNKLTYKLVRVEGDGSYIPASEDEVTEVEHLLAEPRNEKSFVDGVLCFDSENTEKCLLIEDFDSSIDYSQIKANGALGSNNTQGVEDTKFEFLDGMLQGVEEGDLHVANDLASACDDYLLDTEFSEKIPELDYAPCEESDLGNLDFDSHSLDAGDRDREAVEISKSSTTTISVTESASDQNVFTLHKMTIRELQEAFRSTFGRETSVKDKQWLKRRITFGLQNLPELDNISCFLESGISSNENVCNTIFTPGDSSPGRMYHSSMSTSGIKTKPMDQEVKNYRFPDRQTSATSFPEVDHGVSGNLNLGDRVGGSLMQKRLRKPTRRYIEESSDLKPRSCSGRLELPITSSRDKLMRTKSQHRRKAFGAMPLVYRHDSFGGSTIQVPFGLHVRKGRPKKNSSILEHDSEDNKYDLGFSPSESQDDMSDDSVTRTGKGGTRRKHHRLWTLSEVMKLIDGVSRYGVGRWTEIKRLLFSSSAYRTSVDLKDKWRNLLRASGAQLQSKREVEQVRKHATRPIPLPVLRRVSELAIIYPYPRERKSKLVHTGPVTAAPVASSSPTSSDPSVSRSGRVIHRKNLP